MTLKNGGGERVRTAVVSNGSVSHTQKNLAKPEMKIKWENNLNDKVNYRAGKLGHKLIENFNQVTTYQTAEPSTRRSTPHCLPGGRVREIIDETK